MTEGPSRAAAPIAPREQSSAVLHLTSAAGGGVDRYIRDLAANSARPHLIWHVGSRVDVIEHPRGHFLPLARPSDDAAGAALAKWIRAAGTGIVHLHGVSDECRARHALLDRALGLPYVVTLHDVTFVNPGAFEAPGMPAPDPAWIAGLAETLRRAATVIAPSDFMRDIAIEWVPGVHVEIIAPGVRPAPVMPMCTAAAEFIGVAPRRIVAVVGAIGPHKGSSILDALADALAGSEIGIVVIGYTDTQLTRGWVMPGRYYVHGPYLDGMLPGWLAAYGADVVLFPNRLPESFSYTLSEVWSAGIPVVVPDEGALGDRVARHGGGWRLPAGYGAPEAARLLTRILSEEDAGEYARVKLSVSTFDPARVPPLDAMVHDFDALYARYAVAPPDPAATEPAHPEALAPLLAANLDGFAFRQELVRLAEELANVTSALTLATSTPWVVKFENDLAEAKAWAAKLERDIADMQTSTAKLEHQIVDSQNWAAKLERDVADTQASARLLEHGVAESGERATMLEQSIAESQAWVAKLETDVASTLAWAAKLEDDVAELEDRVVGLEKELGRSQAWVAKLEGDVATLNTELAQRVEETRRLADDKAAFDLLPELVRKFLLKRVFRARR